MTVSELVFDPGVLADGPLCEFQSWQAAQRRGGTAILPSRDAWLRASAAGVTAVAHSEDQPDAHFAECIVHLQKSRPATWVDLCAAWRLLRPSGRLLLCGGNDLGIVSAVKKLARELDQKPRILANRAHGRIALFVRTPIDGPLLPEATLIALQAPGEGGDPREALLLARPGVFSARRLDPGSKLLLDALPGLDAPERVLDLGCGAGALGLSALIRWPQSSGVLLDGDARAVASARFNAAELKLDRRCQVEWLDANEPCPGSNFDLVLLNPPFHAGKNVDLEPARAMFEQLRAGLSPGGLGLVVANRKLPYERDLVNAGQVELVEQASGYKLLAVRNRARTSARRPAARPGRRSARRS